MILELDHLRAAAHCCADDDPTRFYLKGVQVEIGPDFATYIGTDGGMLFACQHETEVDERFTGKTFIVARESLKVVRGFDKLELTDVGPKFARGVAIKMGRAAKRVEVQIELIEDRYPDWRHVIPKELTGAVDQYDPRLAYAVSHAFREIGGTGCPEVFHNGDRAALILCEGAPRALGIAMPWRFKSRLGTDDVQERRAALLRPLTHEKKRRPKAEVSADACVDLV